MPATVLARQRQLQSLSEQELTSFFGFVWPVQGNMARDFTGKAVGIFLPLTAFVAMG